jgi:hypothetical protein
MFRSKVSRYKERLIVTRKNGADLVDPVTGNWLHFSTSRSAKWHASIMDRVQTELAMSGVYRMPRNVDMGDLQ